MCVTLLEDTRQHHYVPDVVRVVRERKEGAGCLVTGLCMYVDMCT